MLNFLARFQFFIYPFIVHLSVVYQVPFVIACLLPLFYWVLARPFQGIKKSIVIKSSLWVLLMIIAGFSGYYLDHSIIYLPPILMMLTILYPFIRSILAGNTPLLTRFYQLTKIENNPDVIRYTTKLTYIWIVFISVLLLNNILLSIWAPLEVWSLFTNFINYLLILSLLIGEWLFRLFWFNKWESPIEFAQQLLLIDQRELFR
jgi:uncharacterized membrane protein